MDLSRRQFVILTAAVAAGCSKADNGSRPPPSQPATPATTTSAPTTAPEEKIVDAGLMSDFPSDAVYDSFRGEGLFVIRRDGQLFALSSVCTHKGCKVRAQEDQSFLCKCHGSTFDPEGKVTKGPAKRDLPRLAVRTDDKKHLLVNLNQPLNPTG